jgi:hypothetical protein
MPCANTPCGAGGTGRVVAVHGSGISAGRYSKLQGAETLELTRELREHGIRVQESTIIGLEHHTPDNIMAEIEHAVSHETDFHQFMLYTPVPGTPLYQQMAEEERLLRSADYADVHGRFKFNFSGNFAGRFQTLPRLGILARLPTQRAKPVPHFTNLDGGLESATKTGRMRACGSGLRARWAGLAAYTARR